MGNENCLAGVKCPKCGNEGKFFIHASAEFEVTDDGTDLYSGVGWDENSCIRCADCGHNGRVSDFTEREENLKPFEVVGAEIGALLEEKNRAYGSAFEKASDILKVLFPNGVQPAQYQDLLVVTRVIDKLFRIANDKTAFNEDPWKDIAGYAILSLWSQRKRGGPK